MSRKLLKAPKKRLDSGSTSHNAERARGSPIEEQAKETQVSSGGVANQQRAPKAILKIDGKDRINSVVFVTGGKHILSGGWERNIRRWRLEDGKEVGSPMEAGGWVHDIAVSKDGEWVVGGSSEGHVSVWSAENHKWLGEMKGHRGAVNAVDISPHGTKVASGSSDETVCIWMRRTGERLLTLQHDNSVVAVKFSPDGRLLATATWDRSVRVYNRDDGRLLVEFFINVGPRFNQCLAWDHQTHLYVITHDGIIHYLDVATGRTLSQWPIRTDGARNCGCIALSGNRRFLAASAGSSISFWDTTTRTRIGSDIDCDDTVWSMAISENHDIAKVGHGETTTVWSLSHILPSHYAHDLTAEQNVDSGEKVVSRVRDEQSKEKLTSLEKTVQELKSELRILYGRCELQLRELAMAQKENSSLKSSVEAKDREIGTLTAELDHWRCADADKAKELAAAHNELEGRRRDSEELTAVRQELEDLRRDSEELTAVREELQFSQSQTVETREWYDEQFRQLKSIVEEHQCTPFLVQNFITQADARAEMNIIETLERLNEGIHWSSTFIADRVIHNFRPVATDSTEEKLSITKRVTDFIGQPLVNRLRSSSRDEVAAYLPIALRTYLVYHLHGIISSWSISSGYNQLIRELYNVVRKLESQTISGRWRSLTYASPSQTRPSNPDVFLTSTIDGLSRIIVTAGCALSASAAKELIASKFRGRIFSILTAAQQLTKSIMDALSADFRVETVRPTETLDDRTMEVDSVGRGVRPKTQRVLCTAQIGLSKEVITQSGTGPNKKNTLTTTNIVKTKVFLG